MKSFTDGGHVSWDRKVTDELCKNCTSAEKTPEQKKKEEEDAKKKKEEEERAEANKICHAWGLPEFTEEEYAAYKKKLSLPSWIQDLYPSWAPNVYPSPRALKGWHSWRRTRPYRRGLFGVSMYSQGYFGVPMYGQGLLNAQTPAPVQPPTFGGGGQNIIVGGGGGGGGQNNGGCNHSSGVCHGGHSGCRGNSDALALEMLKLTHRPPPAHRSYRSRPHNSTKQWLNIYAAPYRSPRSQSGGGSGPPSSAGEDLAERFRRLPQPDLVLPSPPGGSVVGKRGSGAG